MKKLKYCVILLSLGFTGSLFNELYVDYLNRKNNKTEDVKLYESYDEKTLDTNKRYIIEKERSELELLIDKYSDDYNNSLKISLERTVKFDSYIERAAYINKLDKSVIAAVIAVESSGYPSAVSKNGAIGLMQLMPKTAKQLSVKDSMHPESIIKASGYLADLINKHGEELGLAAYNCGPNKIKKLKDKHGDNFELIFAYLPKETRAYIAKVLVAKEIAKNL